MADHEFENTVKKLRSLIQAIRKRDAVGLTQQLKDCFLSTNDASVTEPEVILKRLYPHVSKLEQVLQNSVNANSNCILESFKYMVNALLSRQSRRKTPELRDSDIELVRIINRAIDQSDPLRTLNALRPLLRGQMLQTLDGYQKSGFIHYVAHLYHHELGVAKSEKGTSLSGSELIAALDVLACIVSLNEALDKNDPYMLMCSLTNPDAYWEEVVYHSKDRFPLEHSKLYLTALRKARERKADSGRLPILTHAEVQTVISLCAKAGSRKSPVPKLMEKTPTSPKPKDQGLNMALGESAKSPIPEADKTIETLPTISSTEDLLSGLKHNCPTGTFEVLRAMRMELRLPSLDEEYADIYHSFLLFAWKQWIRRFSTVHGTNSPAQQFLSDEAVTAVKRANSLINRMLQSGVAIAKLNVAIGKMNVNEIEICLKDPHLFVLRQLLVQRNLSPTEPQSGHVKLEDCRSAYAASLIQVSGLKVVSFVLNSPSKSWKVVRLDAGKAVYRSSTIRTVLASTRKTFATANETTCGKGKSLKYDIRSSGPSTYSCMSYQLRKYDIASNEGGTSKTNYADRRKDRPKRSIRQRHAFVITYKTKYTSEKMSRISGEPRVQGVFTTSLLRLTPATAYLDSICSHIVGSGWLWNYVPAVVPQDLCNIDEEEFFLSHMSVPYFYNIFTGSTVRWPITTTNPPIPFVWTNDLANIHWPLGIREPPSLDPSLLNLDDCVTVWDYVNTMGYSLERWKTQPSPTQVAEQSKPDEGRKRPYNQTRQRQGEHNVTINSGRITPGLRTSRPTTPRVQRRASPQPSQVRRTPVPARAATPALTIPPVINPAGECRSHQEYSYTELPMDAPVSVTPVDQQLVDSVVQIQAHWRGYRQRREYQNRLDFLHSESSEQAAIRLQNFWRQRRAQRRMSSLLVEHRRYIRSVMKIQALWRGRREREAHQSLYYLANLTNPTGRPTPRMMPTQFNLQNSHASAREPLGSINALACLSKYIHCLDGRASKVAYEKQMACFLLGKSVLASVNRLKNVNRELVNSDQLIKILVQVRLHGRTQSFRSDLERNAVTPFGEIEQISTHNTHQIKSNDKWLDRYGTVCYLLYTQPDYLVSLLTNIPESAIWNSNLLNKPYGFDSYKLKNYGMLLERIVLGVFRYAATLPDQVRLLHVFSRFIHHFVGALHVTPSGLDCFTDGKPWPFVLRLAVSLARMRLHRTMTRRCDDEAYLVENREMIKQSGPLRTIVCELVEAILEADLLENGKESEEMTELNTTRLQPLKTSDEDSQEWNTDAFAQNGNNFATNRQACVTSFSSMSQGDSETTPRLLSVTDAFFHGLFVDPGPQLIPQCLKYVAVELYRALRHVFPREPEKKRLKFIGHCLIRQYFSSTIIAPELFFTISKEDSSQSVEDGGTSTAPRRGRSRKNSILMPSTRTKNSGSHQQLGYDSITVKHRRTLAAISRLLYFVMANKSYAAKEAPSVNVHDKAIAKSQLAELFDPFIRKWHGQFQSYMLQLVNTPNLQPQGNINPISLWVSGSADRGLSLSHSSQTEKAKLLDLGQLGPQKTPCIMLSAGELTELHKLLLRYEDVIAPHPSDQLHTVLRQLGPVPPRMILTKQSASSSSSREFWRYCDEDSELSEMSPQSARSLHDKLSSPSCFETQNCLNRSLPTRTKSISKNSLHIKFLATSQESYSENANVFATNVAVVDHICNRLNSLSEQMEHHNSEQAPSDKSSDRFIPSSDVYYQFRSSCDDTDATFGFQAIHSSQLLLIPLVPANKEHVLLGCLYGVSVAYLRSTDCLPMPVRPCHIYWPNQDDDSIKKPCLTCESEVVLRSQYLAASLVSAGDQVAPDHMRSETCTLKPHQKPTNLDDAPNISTFDWLEARRLLGFLLRTAAAERRIARSLEQLSREKKPKDFLQSLSIDDRDNSRFIKQGDTAAQKSYLLDIQARFSTLKQVINRLCATGFLSKMDGYNELLVALARDICHLRAACQSSEWDKLCIQLKNIDAKINAEAKLLDQQATIYAAHALDCLVPLNKSTNPPRSISFKMLADCYVQSVKVVIQSYVGDAGMNGMLPPPQPPQIAGERNCGGYNNYTTTKVCDCQSVRRKAREVTTKSATPERKTTYIKERKHEILVSIWMLVGESKWVFPGLEIKLKLGDHFYVVNPKIPDLKLSRCRGGRATVLQRSCGLYWLELSSTMPSRPTASSPTNSESLYRERLYFEAKHGLCTRTSKASECIPIAKRHRAAGPDDLPTSFKEDGEFLSQYLSSLFGFIWEKDVTVNRGVGAENLANLQYSEDIAFTFENRPIASSVE
ncbi:IQ motif containing GTPase activating protein [Clonorchis sinensis]|uniref:IQ motif containing GTPase activating protein n=1 Tax=Clonorchis sinensis TaxID=79923 RepID=G7YM15_CLOSI|nr:IQ motif containing GTPase activating protein [Clonorchis sinensis]